jgi:hypothetical protein
VYDLAMQPTQMKDTMTTTLISGTQKMQLRTVFFIGQGWVTQRFDLEGTEWELSCLSAPIWFWSEKECARDLQKRLSDFVTVGWKLID